MDSAFPRSLVRRSTARVRPAHGLACDVDHEDRRQRVDLPARDGGGATGPHPGQLLRAALGACLVVGYRRWSARLGVPFSDVTLTVSAEYDARGELEADAWAGWQRVVFDAVFVTDADEGDVLRLADCAHRGSPMLANLAPAVGRVFCVRVVPTSGASRTD